jgi:hypothetical protein
MKLRFTIRDLLWLALVVALATAWWWDHNRLESVSMNRMTLHENIRTGEAALHDGLTGNWYVRQPRPDWCH